MLDESDLWIAVVKQSVIDCQLGDEDSCQFIIETAAPICKKLELTSVAFYLLKIANGKSIPFSELPKVKKTRRTLWQQHLGEVQNLMESVPNITQSEMVRRLGIPRGRIVNCIRFLRENKQISSLEC